MLNCALWIMVCVVSFKGVDDDAKTATFECYNKLYVEMGDVDDDDEAQLTDHDAMMFY